MNARLEKARGELTQYERLLFALEAHALNENEGVSLSG